MADEPKIDISERTHFAITDEAIRKAAELAARKTYITATGEQGAFYGGSFGQITEVPSFRDIAGVKWSAAPVSIRAFPFTSLAESRAAFAGREAYFSQTISTISDLASLHIRQSMWEQAKADYDEVLEFCHMHRKEFPLASALGIAETFSNLSTISQREGNFSEAENYLRQAIEIYRLLVDKAEDAPFEAMKADQFFTEEQRERLTKLMDDLKKARDESRELSAEDQAELERLIEAELEASILRLEKDDTGENSGGSPPR